MHSGLGQYCILCIIRKMHCLSTIKYCCITLIVQVTIFLRFIVEKTENLSVVKIYSEAVAFQTGSFYLSASNTVLTLRMLELCSSAEVMSLSFSRCSSECTASNSVVLHSFLIDDDRCNYT